MTIKRHFLFLTLAVFSTFSVTAATMPTDGVELLIPIAGYAAGANGEFFSTDVTLVSLSRGDQRVTMTWLPAGTGQTITRVVNLEGVTYQPLVHVVRQVFGAEGVGAIRISASNPTSPTPPSIDAQARVWTQTVSSSLSGTVSHTVPAIRLEGWRDGSPAYVHGVRQNPAFRTNYGIVNLDSVPRQFRVMVNSAGGRFEETVTVRANGLLHKRLPGTPDGELSIYIEPIGPQFGPWRAYAATTDNESGSSWTVLAIQPRTDVQF